MNAIGVLDVVLNIAASEAVAAGYAEITVGHLLIALAKVSELNGTSPEAGLALPARQEFDLLGIDPRRFRRRLRELFGRRGNPPQSALVHRTPACKTVISDAEGLARAAGVPLDASLLVRAAFAGWVASGGSGSDGLGIAPIEEIPTEL